MEEIFLDNYGMFLGKKSERLVVKEKSEVKKEVPFFKVEKVFITSRGVSLSTDAIEECMKSGIQINFLNFKNQPYAKLSSPFLQGTVKTRREQLAAFDNQKGVTLARSFVQGKVNNQLVLLKYLSKYRKKRSPSLYNYITERITKIEHKFKEIEEIKGNCIDDLRQELMTLEANCAKKYWSSVKKILPDSTDFPGRETQGADDLVNCMLNYGYAILYSQAQGAIIQAGLDPFAGFLHVDRPGRASLVLDFVEEFRQQLVDRTVFGMVNQGQNLEIDDDGQMEDDTKNKLRDKIMDRLNSYIQYEGEKHKFKAVIQSQARHMATFLRGERKYEPFVGTW